MSLAELLPAIRALPKAEQVQLLHLLVDGVAAAPAPASNGLDDDIPVSLRSAFPPEGVPEVWIPDAITTDAPGAEALTAALAELKSARS